MKVVTVSTIIMFISLTKIYAITLAGHEKSPKSIEDIKQIVSKYSAFKLESNLRKIVKTAHPSRMTGAVGHEQVVNYLIDTIKKIDKSGKSVLVVDHFEPDINDAIKFYKKDFLENKNGSVIHAEEDKLLQKFSSEVIRVLEKVKTIKGKNVVWEKIGDGTSREFLVVTAHIDTILFNRKTMEFDIEGPMPGADNNATGMAILLALIELLASVDIKKNVRVVFLDFEELGGFGRKAFVKKYKHELKNLVGFVNLSMLGHDTKRSDRRKRHGNMRLYVRDGNSNDIKFARKLASIGEKITSKVRFEISEKQNNYFDLVDFGENGNSSVMFSHDWENDYNKKRFTQNDFVETLNMNTFYNSFTYIAGTVLAWCQVPF